jgi:cAMP phosphodiesterase
MKKTATLFDEMIYIIFKCTLHLHGHHNKVMPFMSPLYLQILTMVLISITTFAGRLMTFKTIISHVKSTITSATKT